MSDDTLRPYFTWGNAYVDACVSLVLHEDGISFRITSEGMEPEVFLTTDDAVRVRDQVQMITEDETGDLWSGDMYYSPDENAALEVHSGPGGRVWLGAWGPKEGVAKRYCLERPDAKVYAAALDRLASRLVQDNGVAP